MRIIYFLLLSASCFAQTPAPVWYKVAVEPNVVSTNGPVNYRFGSAAGTTNTGVNCAIGPQCWSATVTATLTNAKVTNAGNPPFLSPDPAPGILKELDIQQISSPQTVIVNGNTITVPALPSTTTQTLLVTCTTTVTIIVATNQVTTSNSTCTAVAQ